MTRLGRKRSFLERHWPWFLLAFGASGALFVLGAAVDLGLLASIEAFGSDLARVHDERRRPRNRVRRARTDELRLRVPQARLSRALAARTKHARGLALGTRLFRPARRRRCRRPRRLRRAELPDFDGQAALRRLLDAHRQRSPLASALRRGAARRGARPRQLFAAREPCTRRGVPRRDRKNRGRALAALPRAHELGARRDTLSRRARPRAREPRTRRAGIFFRARDARGHEARRTRPRAQTGPRAPAASRAPDRPRSGESAVSPPHPTPRRLCVRPARENPRTRRVRRLRARRFRARDGVQQLPRKHLRGVAALDARARDDEPHHDRADEPGREAHPCRRKKSGSEARLRHLPRPRGSSLERRQHAAAPGAARLGPRAPRRRNFVRGVSPVAGRVPHGRRRTVALSRRARGRAHVLRADCGSGGQRLSPERTRSGFPEARESSAETATPCNTTRTATAASIAASISFSRRSTTSGRPTRNRAAPRRVSIVTCR